MYYYKVLPADPSYTDNKPLTYHSNQAIPALNIVKVTLKNKLVSALITESTTAPRFKTKPIHEVSIFALPQTYLNLWTWLGSYYPAASGKLLSLFLPSYLRMNAVDSPKQANSLTEPQNLNNSQSKIVNNILKSNASLHLLHGDTGSGKTRIHLQLAYKMLLQNKSVLLLTPEIGLAPQLLRSAVDAFGERCIVFHSGMTPKQRSIAWQYIASTQTPLVVVGTRSALFLPTKNLGLIVVDEFHDNSYKQDQSPYYQTSRVAAKLAKIAKAKTVLASATPPVADYYVFKQKKLPIYRLQGTAIQHNFKDTITIVDRKDSSSFTQSRLIANTAIQSLKHNHKANLQTLIFHNRRGTARTILCSECGWQQMCPKCDINMTYHADKHRVICHSCGLNHNAPTSCKDCKNQDIVYRNEGTKAIESEIQKILPQSTVARFDGDNTKQESLDRQYHKIATNKISVIIGTQMITKGLDLPHLRSVIVVAAENQLQFPDFSANEKTFQQISQVIGRAKRGHQATEVIVQSLKPSSELLRQATSNDYDTFFANEIRHRKRYGFPPFAYLLILKVSRKTLPGVMRASTTLHNKLKESFPRLDISEPHPNFREKVNNQFRWQIVVKAKKRESLLVVIQNLPTNTTYDIDPDSLL